MITHPQRFRIAIDWYWFLRLASLECYIKIPAKACNYCKQQFTRCDSLKKHIKDRCKVKKLEEKKKENIFIDLINKEKEINRLNDMEISKRMEKLEKENKSLKNNIKKLEKNQKDAKKTQ